MTLLAVRYERDGGGSRLGRLERAKIVCVGLNYRAHAAETGQPIPETPVRHALREDRS